MRYLILCALSLVLFFSCGSETTSTAIAKPAITEKAKPVATGNTEANSDARYWNFIKRKVSLKPAQVKEVKKVNQKYAGEIAKLKKKKQWKGVKKKELLDKKNAGIKKVLGNSYGKWENANAIWLDMNK